MLLNTHNLGMQATTKQLRLQSRLIKMLIITQSDYIRFELLYRAEDIGLLAQHSTIHDLEGRYHPQPLLLRKYRFGLVAYIHIPGNNNHQLVT